MTAAALSEEAERFRVELAPCAVVVGITGHRPARLGALEPADPRRYWLREQLIAQLRQLGATLLWSGGAQGAAEDGCRVAIHLGIRFRLALPFPGYDEAWTPEARKRAHRIRSQALSVEYVSAQRPRTLHEATRFYLERNAFLIRRIDHLIAVWDGEPGGTAHTVSLAEAIGRPWTRIDPRDYGAAHAPS
jgi:uncharacterized phage-like protein YoqJ